MPDEYLDLDVTDVAHGGVFVARHEGRVVFVADAIDGERVRVQLTDTAKSSFWRADVVEVLDASPHRRAHVWPAADVATAPADRPGGAEFGHIDLAHQRALKQRVLDDALIRFAGIPEPDTTLQGSTPTACAGARESACTSTTRGGSARSRRAATASFRTPICRSRRRRSKRSRRLWAALREVSRPAASTSSSPPTAACVSSSARPPSAARPQNAPAPNAPQNAEPAPNPARRPDASPAAAPARPVHRAPPRIQRPARPSSSASAIVSSALTRVGSGRCTASRRRR